MRAVAKKVCLDMKKFEACLNNGNGVRDGNERFIDQGDEWCRRESLYVVAYKPSVPVPMADAAEPVAAFGVPPGVV